MFFENDLKILKYSNKVDVKNIDIKTIFIYYI